MLICTAIWMSQAQANAGQRWRCTFVDGGVRVVNEDLSRSYPTTVQSCEAFSAPAVPQGDQGVDLTRRLQESELTPGQGTMSIVPWGRSAPSPLIAHSGPVLKPREMPPELADMVRQACARYGLDPVLVSALIYVESRYRPDARSPKGAMGLMQIMPATGARYGVGSASALRDPRVNVDVGTRYLRDLNKMFRGQTELVLAAYNAGEGAVTKYGWQIPPYRETQSYVKQIMALVKLAR